jgi:hypothetical protein
LRPLLEDQLQPGTTVISHNYPIPDWRDKLIDDAMMEESGEKHLIFKYRR